MGLLAYVAKKVAQAGVVFLIVVFIPGLPPEGMDFSAYSFKPPSRLEGVLEVNTKLNGAERLFENELKGPEGLAVYKGELYTGLHGGHLVKIKNNKIIPILKFGKSCASLWEESKCGRILGFKFDKFDRLYAVDAYYGIFQVNMTSGTYETVVEKDEIIQGKPVKLPNSVDVSSDGSVLYWTTSSTTHNLHDGLYTLLGDANGRVMKTYLKKKTHEVLVENLHFPNGVVLSQDESFLLIAETARLRVLRYYLKGEKKGSMDVFIDGLPGTPDNLKRDHKSGFYIPLIFPAGEDKPYLPGYLARFPIIRKFLARTLALIELSIKFFSDLYPNIYFEKALHFVGHFESFPFLCGKRVTVIRTDEDGKVVETLHASDGSVTGICDIEYFNGAYYLGSPFNPYLGRLVASPPA